MSENQATEHSRHRTPCSRDLSSTLGTRVSAILVLFYHCGTKVIRVSGLTFMRQPILTEALHFIADRWVEFTCFRDQAC